jgi:Tfp pilus assembly major pilin PilA
MRGVKRSMKRVKRRIKRAKIKLSRKRETGSSTFFSTQQLSTSTIANSPEIEEFNGNQQTILSLRLLPASLPPERPNPAAV